ncbi:hypothetical protein P691DRAFT_794407 [Macrolepiota fuliginosa MF-IS2]|uniref:Endonuclease/exonuclease/phosphatase domain-containing protein n=1 Tax=Macrolepiota fuliginosa MF-IS2 TaxID=1400762 RepID=A0A9P5XAQ0_9AGAR|nr:hypothetical protein P691DRAFT_794407 [Macrolepiota fuliginosa MF-IS2]
MYSLALHLLNEVPNELFKFEVQRLYRYNEQDEDWLPLQLSHSPPPVHPSGTPTQFQVITWNIDFSTPLVEERTTAILDYIQNRLLSSSAPNNPTVILFQEVHPEAIEAMLSHSFIQNHYDMTDISNRHFSTSYGTVTLVPKCLTPFVSSVSRIPFENSGMGRDVLTVDFGLPFRSVTRRIRISNVHLESLRGHGDKARPEQLKFVSELLATVDGGLVAGDMNAIAPTDDRVPQTLGLIDCWEVMHPQAAEEEGHTWGYQPRGRYPAGRLDKVLVSGSLAPLSIGRLGVGQYIRWHGDNYWLSDHFGILAQIRTT